MTTQAKKPKARAASDGSPRYGAMNRPRLVQLMAERGLRVLALQQKLADEYGVKVMVSRLISGARRPSLDTLTALALALECELADLWNIKTGARSVKAARAE